MPDLLFKHKIRLTMLASYKEANYENHKIARMVLYTT